MVHHEPRATLYNLDASKTVHDVSLGEFGGDEKNHAKTKGDTEIQGDQIRKVTQVERKVVGDVHGGNFVGEGCGRT